MLIETGFLAVFRHLGFFPGLGWNSLAGVCLRFRRPCVDFGAAEPFLSLLPVF